MNESQQDGVTLGHRDPQHTALEAGMTTSDIVAVAAGVAVKSIAKNKLKEQASEWAMAKSDSMLSGFKQGFASFVNPKQWKSTGLSLIASIGVGILFSAAVQKGRARRQETRIPPYMPPMDMPAASKTVVSSPSLQGTLEAAQQERAL